MHAYITKLTNQSYQQTNLRLMTQITKINVECKANFCSVKPIFSFRGEVRGANRVYNDDVIKWKHFPRYWPFVRGIHRWPVNSPLIGQWHGALVFSLICAWINVWVNRESGDLRRHCAHYDVTVMFCKTYYTISREVSCIRLDILIIMNQLPFGFRQPWGQSVLTACLQ